MAVFAALYVGAQVVAVAVLSGTPVPWLAVAVAALTGWGTYLVDRIGPTPGPPDRGDMRSTPDRVRFLWRFDTPARVLAVLALGGAFMLALPWGGWASLVPLSVIGVLIYARWAPPGRRIKDRLWLKTLAIAASITVFALAMVHVAVDAPLRLLGIAGAVVFFRVMADAMRCDIDDADSDARVGTRTIANVFSPTTAWRCALLLDCVAVGFAVAAVPLVGMPALAVGVIPCVASMVLMYTRPAAVRDWVDFLGTTSVAVAWAVSV